MTIYMCEPVFEGILCGVYDAWSDPAGHEEVRLVLKGEYEEIELFASYRDVELCPEKVGKVIQAVCRKISQEVYRKIYTASLSQDKDRADKIYRFLIQAFRHGPAVLDMLQLPACYDIFQMCRNVYNENHLLTEFLRFSQTPAGILVARIGPKNDVMTLLAPHFADRLPEEDWVIYDEIHRRAAIHPAGRPWFLVKDPLEPEQEKIDSEWQCWLKEQTDEEVYEDMWRMFCDTIAIKERNNPLCQRTHLPLRFRPYMTEFKKNHP